MSVSPGGSVLLYGNLPILKHSAIYLSGTKDVKKGQCNCHETRQAAQIRLVSVHDEVVEADRRNVDRNNVGFNASYACVPQRTPCEMAASLVFKLSFPADHRSAEERDHLKGISTSTQLPGVARRRWRLSSGRSVARSAIANFRAPQSQLCDFSNSVAPPYSYRSSGAAQIRPSQPL